MTTTESYHIAAIRLHLQELRRIAQILEPTNDREEDARDELEHELWHTAVLVDDIEISFERL